MFVALLLLAVAWDRWETPVPAPATAQIAGPAGEAFQVPTFRAGDGREMLRFAFPSPGVWRWEAGVARGSVKVSRGKSTPLVRHGFLRVSANNRHLIHDDATPFLWMGDTPWYASFKASLAEWSEYLTIRAKQRFSVVQISTGREPADWTGVRPFDPQGEPSAAYWDAVDAKVRLANQRGFAVVMVGLGRPTAAADIPHVERPEFARYIAGRFAGDHVIFSPNFDGIYSPVFDMVAEHLFSVDRRHLITQHPGTRKGQNELYVPKPYLAFTGLQSGHHAGRLEQAYTAARNWPLALWSMTPVRPVINMEGMYDGRGSDEGQAWRGQDVRKIGWISWLSGALGYTYGAGETSRKVPGTKGGVWGWNQDAAAWDHWRKAVEWPSASHMTAMRDFFASVPWWKLEPARDLLESGDPYAVMAATPDRSIAVVYFPSGGEYTVNLPHRMTETWIDPLTGKSTKSKSGERVLLLRRR